MSGVVGLRRNCESMLRGAKEFCGVEGAGNPAFNFR